MLFRQILGHLASQSLLNLHKQVFMAHIFAGYPEMVYNEKEKK